MSAITYTAQDHLVAAAPGRRAAGLAAIAAPLLVVSGLVVAVAAGRPETTLQSTDAEVAAALREAAGAGVWAGAAMEAAGLLLLLVFAGGAAQAAVAREARVKLLSDAGLLAAAAFVAVSLAALAVGGLVSEAAGPGADLVAAGVLNDLWGGLYALSWAPCGAFLVLLGLALRRSGALPAPVAVAGVAIGAASLAATAAPASQAGQAVAFLPWLWLLAAGVVLVRPETTKGAR
jgi:hypothetical protein